MELTKPFSPRPSKSLDHFNFLLGCSIGVLGERERGGEGGRETATQAGPEERESERGRCGVFISRGPEVCGNAAESGEIRGKMQQAAVRGLRQRPC